MSQVKLAVGAACVALQLVWLSTARVAAQKASEVDLAQLLERAENRGVEAGDIFATATITAPATATASSADYQSVETIRLHRRGRSAVLLLEKRTTRRGRPPERHQRLFAYNETYAFWLERPDPDHPWTLKSLAAPDSQEDWALIRRDIAIYERWLGVPGPTLLRRSSLKELLRHPQCRFSLAETGTYANQPALVLSFEFTPSDDPSNSVGFSMLPAKGRITLHKDNGQLLQVEARVRYVDGEVDQTELYWYDSGSGHLRRYQETGGNQWQTVVEVTHWSRRCRHDPSIFRLSGYGLPEPEWARQERRWWVWLLGLAGVACVVLGLWVLQRRRQQ